MTWYDIATSLDARVKVVGVGAIFVVIMSLVQVSKIEINPWTWVGKILKSSLQKFGSILNEDLINKLDNTTKDVKELSSKVNNLSSEIKFIKDDREEEKAKINRNRILRFGDELRSEPLRLHTKERFDEVLRLISSYNNYCDDHPQFENDKANLTIEYIHEVYKECLKNNSFL